MESGSVILAGDAGGTKTRLACFEIERGRLISRQEEKYASRDFPSLSAIINRFLQEHPAKIESACFGVPGPVFRGRCQPPNLPWSLDVAELASSTGIPQVALLNDLEATAYSLGELTADQITELQPGMVDAEGNAGVIAAGTGLGEAGMLWNGRSHVPFACEGGHVDFSPRNDLELELLHYLFVQFGHASWERVLSGPGLVNIYRFLSQRTPDQGVAAVTARMAEHDPAAVIFQAATEQHCPLCMQALDLFITLYGSEAGNLALKLMARGGVYLAGGIAPKIIARLRQPAFLEAFADKGRMRSLLQSIPVRVVLTDRAALIGAAHYARLQHPVSAETAAE